MQINIVCPHCENQATYEFEGTGTRSLVCSSCEKPFEATFAEARSKRSRGNKSTNSRSYKIRATCAGVDEFFEFESNTYDDAELKSKDLFVLSAINGRVLMLQNLTIRKYWKVASAAPSFSEVAIGLGVIIVLLIVIVAAFS